MKGRTQTFRSLVLECALFAVHVELSIIDAIVPRVTEQHLYAWWLHYG
jgi:hypothetical protein